MTLSNSFDELIQYQKDIEDQKAVLQTSEAFSTQQKKEISEIYDRLHKIATSRIKELQELDQALNA